MSYPDLRGKLVMDNKLSGILLQPLPVRYVWLVEVFIKPLRDTVTDEEGLREHKSEITLGPCNVRIGRVRPCDQDKVEILIKSSLRVRLIAVRVRRSSGFGSCRDSGSGISSDPDQAVTQGSALTTNMPYLARASLRLPLASSSTASSAFAYRPAFSAVAPRRRERVRVPCFASFAISRALTATDLPTTSRAQFFCHFLKKEFGGREG
ncbi:hypothetical protein ACS0TY_008214 [Phlomoides rotata]